jgi:hypothetical protein
MKEENMGVIPSDFRFKVYFLWPFYPAHLLLHAFRNGRGIIRGKILT